MPVNANRTACLIDGKHIGFDHGDKVCVNTATFNDQNILHAVIIKGRKRSDLYPFVVNDIKVD